MILKGKGGIQYNLEATPFAQGGEGQIFNINGQPDKVAKLYKAGKITPEHERKLLKMVITPPERDVLDQIAWPLDVLYDNNKFVGFIMRKFKLNEDLNVIYEYGSSAKYPEMTWGNKIRIAKNLCVVLNAVHEAGHVCGDFNPKNISVDPNTGHITFVDTDSYHITDGSNTYRCNVGMPEYLPVEIQKKMHNGLSNAVLPTFSQATDNFALAVHIFQLLMNGVHPFACAVIPSQDSVPIPDTSDSILKGECPFFKDVPGKQIPKFAPPADILPQEIKKLFLLAFVDGHASPAARPSAETWYYALEKLEKNLKKCKDVGHHEYHNGQSSCPWCAADKRFSGALSSAKSKGLKQSNFTPPVAPPTRSPSYTPSYASVSSTRGSSSPSYVGANNYGSASNYKKGGFTKKLIGGIIAVVLIAALFGFVIWPKLIYPNMSNDDFNTPEIVQSYCGSIDKDSSRYNDEIYNYIFTISSCDGNGNLQATCEWVHEKDYGKYTLTGKITEKKNNGNVMIDFVANQWEYQPEGETWFDRLSVEITDNFTKFSSNEITLYSGTNDEFEIKTAADLRKLSGSDEFYIIKNDIDLSGTNWTPIDGFTGVLMGNGYSIKNLKIESSASNVGFFSTLDGTVMNLKFENAEVSVDGRTENIGILCGTLNGTALKVNASGNITAKKSSNVGGIVGNVGTLGSYSIANLINKASVTGLSYVGGVIGRINNDIPNGCVPYVVTLVNLVNEGDVTAIKNCAAGIVGYLFGEDSGFGGSVTSVITDCVNKGTISGNYYVGGILGYGECDTYSTIENCINQSTINANAYVGCIAGATLRFCISDSDNEGSVLQASGYSMEDGQKYAYVGGLVGKGTCLENCINYIDINYNAGGKFVGGLMGYCNLGDAIRGVSLASDTASANIKNLVNKGNVTGNSYVGGIMGGLMYYWNNGCTEVTVTFEKLLNSGSIVAQGDFAGGLSGYIAGDVGGIGGGIDWCIYDSENSGNVSGNKNVGGLFGGFKNGKESGSAYASNTVLIEGCTSTGTVSGKSNRGNIIGLNEIKK